MQIFTSDAATPPFRRDGSVKELCTITCNNVDILWENVYQYSDSKGDIYYRLDNLCLTMKFEGEPKWALKVGNKTVEQNVNVQYYQSEPKTVEQDVNVQYYQGEPKTVEQDVNVRYYQASPRRR